MNILAWVAIGILVFNVVFFGTLWIIYLIHDYQDYKIIRQRRNQRKD